MQKLHSNAPISPLAAIRDRVCELGSTPTVEQPRSETMQNPLAQRQTAAAPRVRVADLVELTKPGITFMVVTSCAIGFLMATRRLADPWLLVSVLIGTGLVSGGASAFNHVFERRLDAKMRRTANRPLPTGRVQPDVALLFAISLAICGLTELALTVNWVSALLGAIALVGYSFVYTPLKRVSSLATVLGAVPGAIPPMIGWAAATGTVDTGAWILFGILFFWQMPHFLAIAWLCREDYGRAELPMLTVGDTAGVQTGRQVILYGAALLPMSLMPSVLGLTGGLYFIGALAASLAYLGYCVAFALRPGNDTARKLMFASILYLPAVLAVMVLDRLF